ncbi:hypothetical protein JK208_12210 [Gluconobacter sp. Dm-74]|uniref:DUF5983 family protein n=1 Tax=Gluconobacter sp. Dm-74 TaxID=2799803 RepID=UPI001B8C4922|nr:hypothetical protein [Gluconobacter sp. Dm-74]MBS1092367.1 hypothetical protein [Gluconobacter sp. Dm-74]
MSEVLLTSAGPVCRHLDLSTGHLPVAERDACELYLRSGGTAGRSCLGGPYGWMIHVPTEAEDVPHDVSPELAALMAQAREQDCYYIHFDRDGPIDETLPFYD